MQFLFFMIIVSSFHFNLSDAEILLRMSIEAYKEEEKDVSDFKLLYSYGYEKDGVRSKVFVSKKTVVIATKGTTLYLHGIGLGPTGQNDREMDNLMFSECDREDLDCEYQKKIKIDKLKYLSNLERFIRITLRVFKGYRIILTGHSLGGALSSLMSLKFNLPVVSFSSPGEKYVSTIMGYRPRDSGITHIGICEDSLFVGGCEYLCPIMGYLINTTCHLGKTVCLSQERRILKDVIKKDSLKYHRAESLLRHIREKSSVIYSLECKGY